MKKTLIALAGAASAVAVAAPAAAQYYPAPPPVYGYPAYQAYPAYRAYPAYQYSNGYHQARALQARVDYLQREISRLAQYRMISRAEYNGLRADSREIERRLRVNARDGYGLNPREAYNMQRRIARLEMKIHREVRDGRQWSYRW